MNPTEDPTSSSHAQPVNHIQWIGSPDSGFLRLLDQTRLPTEEMWIDCRTVDDVWQAIKRLSVRGAPAIGIAAAYGCVIGVQKDGEIALTADYLATSRPTAVNLFWAVDRMKRAAAVSRKPDQSSAEVCKTLLNEAIKIHDEDRAACKSIGRYALDLLRELTGEDLRLLTHCNAGALATGGIGTATAPMYLAKDLELPITVFADETRPLLQGARLTAWELKRAGIEVSLITDSTAATVMKQGRISAVITGADRIAANGDAANKIGTYPLAVLAKYHDIPFIVAAPTSTFDLHTKTGDDIPIEERNASEITNGFGKPTAPPGIQTFSPAFDVTPASLITAIVCENGVIRPIDATTVERCIRGSYGEGL